jgi:hypothetical protein
MLDLHQRTEQIFVPRSFFKTSVSRAQPFTFDKYPVVAAIYETRMRWNVIEQFDIRVAVAIVSGKRFRQMNIATC